MNRVIFVLLSLVLVVATISLVTFFGTPSGFQTTFHLKQDKNTVLFAVSPWGDSKKMKEVYDPLLNFIGQKVGKKFQLLVMEDYDSAIEAIVEGDIDIFVLPPVSYVVAREREPNLQYISTQVREREGGSFATYKGYLVALKSRHAGWHLDDFLKRVKEFRLGFVTRKSSSGWAYPMAMMKKRGVDPHEIFREVIFFENHTLVTDAIASGEIDLGATWEYNLEQAREKHGDIFEIVEVTGKMPGIAWVAAKGVSSELIQKIREVQMVLNESPLKKELLKGTPDKGWMVLPESDYDQVREVVKFVGTFE
ncbi:MAG: PhnD/SsuA/transferrin family substrate-binding protein [Deltaproteobacteria bacterium]|nr:PhnD/SsuA/transferrin family substrate-binding protein [Deltaproteobacteria bacterium]